MSGCAFRKYLFLVKKGRKTIVVEFLARRAENRRVSKKKEKDDTLGRLMFVAGSLVMVMLLSLHQPVLELL